MGRKSQFRAFFDGFVQSRFCSPGVCFSFKISVFKTIFLTSSTLFVTPISAHLGLSSVAAQKRSKYNTLLRFVSTATISSTNRSHNYFLPVLIFFLANSFHLLSLIFFLQSFIRLFIIDTNWINNHIHT